MKSREILPIEEREKIKKLLPLCVVLDVWWKDEINRGFNALTAAEEELQEAKDNLDAMIEVAGHSATTISDLAEMLDKKDKEIEELKTKQKYLHNFKVINVEAFDESQENIRKLIAENSDLKKENERLRKEAKDPTGYAPHCIHYFVQTEQFWQKCQHCGYIKPIGQ